VTYSKLRFVTQVLFKWMVENQITKLTLDYLITCKIDKSTQTEKAWYILRKTFSKASKFSFESEMKKVVTSQNGGIYNLKCFFK
jgi:hypothetical protein